MKKSLIKELIIRLLVLIFILESCTLSVVGLKYFTSFKQPCHRAWADNRALNNPTVWHPKLFLETTPRSKNLFLQMPLLDYRILTFHYHKNKLIWIRKFQASRKKLQSFIDSLLNVRKTYFIFDSNMLNLLHNHF